MSLCLAITSGKGGTGKSTVSSGLAMAFADLDKSVLLLDLDAGLRCQDIIMNIDNQVIFDLLDVLSGEDETKGIYPVPYSNKIHLIPAPSQDEKINPEAFSNFIERMKRKYDVVIADFPAGIDFSLYSCLGNDTQFISVSAGDPVSIRDAFVVNNNIPETEFAPRLIINKFDKELIKNGIFGNIDYAIDQSGMRLLGIVPFDRELMLLSVNHKLKKGKSPKKAFQRIAQRLCGQYVPLPKIKKI